MKINNQCPIDGDNRNDCEACVYSGEYHFVDGDCVKRDAQAKEDKEFYMDLLMEQQEQM